MGLGSFLLGAGKAVVKKAEQNYHEVYAAKDEARNWPDEKLIRRYKEADGAKRAGYASELRDRGYNVK